MLLGRLKKWKVFATKALRNKEAQRMQNKFVKISVIRGSQKFAKQNPFAPLHLGG